MRLVNGWCPPEDPPIRVLLAIDLGLYRRGLQALIAREPDIMVAGEAADGPDAVRQVRVLRPDVVLLDVTLVTFDPLDVVGQLLAPQPAPRILLLANGGAEAAAVRALERGAHGYVLNNAAPDCVMDAIRALVRRAGDWADGEAPAEPGPAPGPAEAERALAALPVPSPRELAVLRLVAQGERNRDIALALGSTEKAVKRAISAILDKWHLQDRTQAVIYAVQHGILDPRAAHLTPRRPPARSA